MAELDDIGASQDAMAVHPAQLAPTTWR
jgi:hypothetical protein